MTTLSNRKKLPTDELVLKYAEQLQALAKRKRVTVYYDSVDGSYYHRTAGKEDPLCDHEIVSVYRGSVLTRDIYSDLQFARTGK